MRPAAAVLLSAVLLCAAPLPAAAQPPAAAAQPPATDDPFARHLVPPELVMRHSQAIGLTPEQREAIKTAVQEAQSGFIDPQWQMHTEAGRMAELLQQKPLDQAAILAELDLILDLERRIKKLQFTLLVRIKNTLNAAQLEKLDKLRAQP
jgi:Spy/CpxP family protein refolding chaperone